MSALTFQLLHTEDKSTLTTQNVAMFPFNTYSMTLSAEAALHILETELAYPETSIRNVREFLREGCVVPRLDIVRAEPDGSDSQDIGIKFIGGTGCRW